MEYRDNNKTTSPNVIMVQGDDTTISKKKKKKKIRRSNSSSSNSTVKSQIIQMSQYKYGNDSSHQIVQPTLSDSSDNNMEGKNAHKKRRRTIEEAESDSSDYGNAPSTKKEEVLPKKKKQKKRSKKINKVANNPVTIARSRTTNASKKEGVPPKRMHGMNSSKAIFNKKELKPALVLGEKVFAAYEADYGSYYSSMWYEGRITGTRALEKGGTYGPIRYYNIEYDDGDQLDGVSDAFVFPKFDYLLDTKSLEKQWMGVRNVTDKRSNDNWARLVGYHEATIDGKAHSFPLLSDALRAYDDSIVLRKGGSTTRADLNLPGEWAFKKATSALESFDISRLNGFTFKPEKNKYKATISYDGKKDINLGYYKLASDAALVHDKALVLLKGNMSLRSVRANFTTDQEHEDSRTIEMNRTGLNVDIDTVLSKISSKVTGLLSKMSTEDSSKSVCSPMFTSPSKTSQPKSSRYVGVCYHKTNKKWLVVIYDKKSKRQMNIGYYKLETNAALAYDKALLQLRGPSAKTNFISEEDYEKAKKSELAETGLSITIAMTPSAIETKVNEVLCKASSTSASSGIANTTEVEKERCEMSSAKCSELSLEDAMAKKWAPYLPQVKGNNFIDGYQKSIDGILQELRPKTNHSTPQLSSLVVPVDNVASIGKQNSNEIECAVSTQKWSNTAREDQSMSNAKDHLMTQTRSSKEQSSSAGGTKHDKPTTASTASLENHSKQNAKNNQLLTKSLSSVEQSITSRTVQSTTDTVNTKQSSKKLTRLTSNQVEELDLPYPIGTSVWFHSKCDSLQSFQTGVVTGVYMDFAAIGSLFYQVKLIGKETKQIEMIPDGQLCYAPNCSVFITSTSVGTQCKVLMGRPKSPEDAVLHLKDLLLKESSSGTKDSNQVKLLDIIDQLDHCQMTRKILSTTFIGKSVKQLVKSQTVNNVVTHKARELVNKWKEIAIAEKNNSDTTSHSSQDTFFYTILIVKDANQFHIEENVPARHVKCIPMEENESSNSTITTATGLY